MATLSEKAKGKQRAVETQAPEEQPPATERPLTVRFTDGLADLQLTLEAKDSVRRIKQKIREHRPQVAKRRLRLIYSGRILTDNTILFEWLGSLEKKQKRTVNAQDGKGKGKEKAREDSASDTEAGPGSPEGLGPTWLHCSVGAEMAEKEGEDDEEHVQKSQIKPLRGFDRLAAAGFSEEDIANFRRTFHSQSAANYLDAEPLIEDEDDEEHARMLEERWIESLDGADSAISPTSASTTLLQGLLVGFFFPLLPFFFLHQTRPAVFWDSGHTQEASNSVVFSKRMQMALVLGFILNITFGVWRYVLGG